MATAAASLARSTDLAAVAETLPFQPSPVDNATIEAMLRRGRRWRMTAKLAHPETPPPAIEAKPPATTWDWRLRRAGPYALSCVVSTAVHLVLLLAAALVAASIAASSPPVAVVGAMLEQNDELTEVVVPIVAGDNEADDDEAALTTFASIELDPGATQDGSPELALADFSEGPVGNLLADAAGLSADVGKGKASAGEGEEGGEESGGEQGTEFFGVQASGRKFVFVCDCSRSMTGMKWQELNRELARCIGDLNAGQSFYVIFFDGEVHAMFEPFNREPALLDATAQNIDKARYWIANMTLGRNTSPFESMKFGAAFEPDAMFLLTDGEFSDYTAPYMRDFNKKRKAQGKNKVVVHTIGFFSEKHQLVLERIAKDSGGTYKFVEGPQPVKPKRKSWNVMAPPPGFGTGGPSFGPAFPGAVPSGD